MNVFQPTDLKISPRARSLLREMASLDERKDLSPEEIKAQKTELAGLFLELPEISPAVAEALAELERKVGLSWEVREHIIERFEDALMKFPDAAISVPRLRGLMKRVTSWSIADAVRVGKNSDGDYIVEHPRNASKLDEIIRTGDGEGTSPYEVTENPASIDILETVMRQERLRAILEYAEEEGSATHRTVLRVMLGWSYREIAALEEVSENAIAKRLERFRSKLEALGV